MLSRPEELGLNGIPMAAVLAKVLSALAIEESADLILIDGPQGWRSSQSTIEHMRCCEFETRTPGKTGTPSIVKPATWTRMVEFSITLFDELGAAGWPRYNGSSNSKAYSVETFPTHAWRSLGLRVLPSKHHQLSSLKPWIESLKAVCKLNWPREPNHDELQAVVAGLSGLFLKCCGTTACELHGRAPFYEAGFWREGFILSPKQMRSRVGPS